MQLKAYQTQTLATVKGYLCKLEEMRALDRKARALDPELGGDWAAKAWEKLTPPRPYHARRNALDEPLPSFCLKIPTGGGKTLLAAKAIDLINTHYRKSNRGIVLWIVPTTQIYNQTLTALKDRGHPYRQTLDMASAGRTLIFEKDNVFSPADVEGNLCVLLLMLASANRKNKEVLRAFQDSSGFDAFFPPDGDVSGNTALLQRFPNLDTFESESGFFKRQVKTSLGNTLRMLRPLVIVDEGQKASRDLARGTVEDFNPCMLLELSATPPALANILVDIRGQALADEGMVKLDLHIQNQDSVDWKNTLLAAIEHRRKLEEEARTYEAQTGIRIRPICLIQVERTGKDQRGPGVIHAEDARDYLLQHPGISADQIAIKTAQKDELKEIDNVGGLMGPDCQIRYIITKQALQEGWDCSFAYVLAILTNPASQSALTQLVGRILRQPHARKTGNKWLDESYVFCFQRRGRELLQEVRKGFGKEGLGDLAGRVVTGNESELGPELTVQVRERFKKAAQHLVLPAFMIRDGHEWRPVHYEPDILARVPWGKVDPSPLYKLSLSMQPDRGVGYRVGLDERIMTADPEETGERLDAGEGELDYAFAASHLLDVMPNPWRGNEIARKVFAKLLNRFDRKIVTQNFVMVVDEIHRELSKQRDHLARNVFEEMLADGTMRFMVIADSLEPDGFNRLPKTLALREKEPRAVKLNNLQYELSLFEQMPERGFSSGLEQAVATFLEDQAPLYFWHRNRSRADYFVQGWKKNRIYSDFIFTASDPDEKGSESFNRVFVLETKGRHLAGVRDVNDELTDTGYKRDVFTLCSKLATQKKWSELVPFMTSRTMRFEVVDEDGWKARLSELLK